MTGFPCDVPKFITEALGATPELVKLKLDALVDNPVDACVWLGVDLVAAEAKEKLPVPNAGAVYTNKTQ